MPRGARARLYASRGCGARNINNIIRESQRDERSVLIGSDSVRQRAAGSQLLKSTANLTRARVSTYGKSRVVFARLNARRRAGVKTEKRHQNNHNSVINGAAKPRLEKLDAANQMMRINVLERVKYCGNRGNARES